MSKFRWLYVGSGNIANSTAISILKGNHKITGVYGRTYSKVESFAKKHKAVAYTSYEEALKSNDFDGVYIATPHTSHVDYAIKAMKMGKPVLCEKPVGVSLSDVDKLIECSKENNVYFVEAMWTWFSDVALKVKEWVNSGAIGELKEMEINYSFPGVMMNKNSRVLTAETAGGALLDIGIYPITYAYNLFGYPDKIECTGTLKNGIDIKETVVLTYGNAKCTFNMSLTSLKESCKIIGTKGTIDVPMFHMASKAVLKNDLGKKTFRGKTDYKTEFTRAAAEIKAGKTESEYIPFSSTRNCMMIMDECRKQLGLVYPFE